VHVLVALLALGSMYGAEAASGNTTWLKYQTDMLRELRLNEVIPAGLKNTSHSNASKHRATEAASARSQTERGKPITSCSFAKYFASAAPTLPVMPVTAIRIRLQ